MLTKQHGGRQRAAAAQTLYNMAKLTYPDGAHVATEKAYLNADELQQLREENANAALDNVTADWFDYLRQERNDFVTKFWQYYTDFPLTAQHQVWAENMLLAFDQLFETAAMIYLTKQREWQPDAAAAELISQTMLAVFGDIRKAAPGSDTREEWAI